MMAEALLNSAHVAQHGAFSVAAPFVGDAVSGALLRAYDEADELPADLRSLLDSLDGID